jgi:dynein heavy chain
VQSWLERRGRSGESSFIMALVDKYMSRALDHTRKTFRYSVPMLDFAKVKTQFNMLEALLNDKTVPEGTTQDTYEAIFVFCCTRPPVHFGSVSRSVVSVPNSVTGIWSLGGALYQDNREDQRDAFSTWFRIEYGKAMAIKLPEGGSVFDYVFDTETRKWVPWTERIPEYRHNPELPMQSVVVHTAETVRYRFFLDLFIGLHKPILFVGSAGACTV